MLKSAISIKNRRIHGIQNSKKNKEKFENQAEIASVRLR